MCLMYACIVSMFCPSIIQCSVKKKFEIYRKRLRTNKNLPMDHPE